MRKLISAVVLSAGTLLSSAAYAQAPTTESVERLLSVMKAESMMDSLYTAMEPMLKQVMQNPPVGAKATPEQQKMMEILPGRMTKLMREELNWSVLRADTLRVYQESFSQAEIDGMIAFYESPAGQATLNKLPVVMQKSMAFSQQRIRQMVPKLMKLTEDVAREAGVKR